MSTENQAAQNEGKILDTEFRGFDKKQVIEYIERLASQYATALEQEKGEHEKLKTAYNELLTKYNELSSSYIVLQNDKAQVANALISAENTAKQMIEAAKQDVAQEKMELESALEQLRASLVDKNKMMRGMRMDVTAMYENLKTQISASMQEILQRVETDCINFDNAAGAICSRYQSTEQQEETETDEKGREAQV